MSSSQSPQPSKERQRMRSEAEDALAAAPHLDCPGFESSRVFALLGKLLRESSTRSSLVRNVATVFQFVVLPTAPLDPSNPRTIPRKGSSGGALRPALWYVDLKKAGAIGKGHPPKSALGIKRRADVTIECTDRDLLHMAQGQQHPQRLFNMGRIKIKGDIDRALKIAGLLNQERSRLFGVPPAPEPSSSDSFASDASRQTSPAPADWQREGNDQRDQDYGAGAPAPIPDRAKL